VNGHVFGAEMAGAIIDVIVAACQFFGQPGDQFGSVGGRGISDGYLERLGGHSSFSCGSILTQQRRLPSDSVADKCTPVAWKLVSDWKPSA
jgi:hypothetical protein